MDYGSLYNHLITRRTRRLSIVSHCIFSTTPLTAVAELNPCAVILSGGSHSAHADGAPAFPEGFLEYAEARGVNVLGICYGMQLIVQKLGESLAIDEKQEYGKMEIEVSEGESGLFGPEAAGGAQTVWMSHGDEAATLPEGFVVVARSLQGSVAVIENKSRRFYGLQYHPELARWHERNNRVFCVSRRSIDTLFYDAGLVGEKVEHPMQLKPPVLSNGYLVSLIYDEFVVYHGLGTFLNCISFEPC